MIKKFLTTLFIASSFVALSQAPPTINYQGVARDAAGVPITNTVIGLQFTISTPTNPSFHSETQNNVQVNSLGLFNTKIGLSPQLPSSGWENVPVVLNVAISVGGGSFIQLGSQTLSSVPYALYAQSAPIPTLQLNGNNLSLVGGNSTVTLPGGTTYTNGSGITITGSVISNASPNQTVTISSGTNVSISGLYPNFTVNATPSLSLAGAQLSISGGNSVTLPTGTTYTNGAGISLLSGTIITNTAPNQTVNINGPNVIGAYPNYTITASPATTLTAGNSNITITGVSPNYTVASTPTLNLNINTLSISNGNSVVLPVTPAATITAGNSNITVTGAAPNFTVASSPSLSLNNNTLSISNSNSIVLPPPPTPTINGAGIAAVTPTTGNNFTVSVVSPTLTGVGSTSVSGAYPNFTITTPSVTAGWSLLGNAGTNTLTNFIGTTDNTALRFRLNNFNAGKLDPAGPVFLGYQSGASNANNFNSGVGYQSLFSNVSGGQNSAFGYSTLYSNTTGSFNTSVGHAAIQNNTSGGYNTAVGSNALLSNTTGSFNTATGAQSLLNNVLGSSNTASGFQALNGNVSGGGNSAFGVGALFANGTGSNNVAIGTNALQGNTSGSNNTAGGYQALAQNSSGIFNSAFGSSALQNNTLGNRNAALGTFGLNANTNGSENTASGYAALFSNITGSYNVSSGYSSMFNNTTGIFNTADGYQALYANTTGSFNTISGAYAGFNATGSRNVFIGYQAGYNESASDKLYIANSNVNPPLIYGDFATGRIGLGTTTPTDKLTIFSGAYGMTHTDGTAVVSTYVGNGGVYGGSIGTQSNHPFFIYTNNSGAKLTVLPNGNVGINNTAPTEKLDVNGNILVSGANSNEVNRTQTSDANLVPVAYANINSNGTVNTNASTANVTLASHSVNSGLYYFNIGGESIYYLDHVVAVTLNGTNGEVTWSSAGGQLVIYTYNSSGATTDKPFTFVIYKK